MNFISFKAPFFLTSSRTTNLKRKRKKKLEMIYESLQNINRIHLKMQYH